MIKHPFNPIYNKNSKILILGSFPSVKSREDNFYYAHPQNRFWRVISAVLEANTPETIAEKRELLISRHVALWDTIRSCEIQNSSDVSIKNAVPNDFSPILKNSNVYAVFANGKQSYNLYMKYCKDLYTQDVFCMPSTSPANAGFKLEDLIREWSTIKRYI